MRKITILLAAIATCVLMLPPLWAASNDIVWPTYTLVQKPHDTALTCRQLHAVLDRIAADVRLLDSAKARAEVAVRQAYDTQSSEGREQGGFLNTGTTKAGFTYKAARDAIKESKKVAESRQACLTGLLPACKNAAQGGVAPAQ